MPKKKAPTDQAANLKDIFNLIDEDAGGSISFEEVKHFCSAQETPPADAAVQAVIKKISGQSDGEIDPEQFVTLVAELEKVTGVKTDDMVNLFKDLCYRELFMELEGGDGTGDVGKSDLIKLFTAMEIHGATDEDIRKVFLKYDEDGSGRIEMGEFVGIVSEIAGNMPLSHCVRRFSEARHAAQERMASMRAAFGRDKTPTSPARPQPGGESEGAQQARARQRKMKQQRAARAPAPPPASPVKRPAAAPSTRIARQPSQQSVPVSRQASQAQSIQAAAMRSPVSPVPCFNCATLRMELSEAQQKIADLESRLVAAEGHQQDDAQLAALRAEADESEHRKKKIAALEHTVADMEERLKRKGGADAAKDAKKLHKLQQDLDDRDRKIKVLEGKLEHVQKQAKTLEARALSKAAMQMGSELQAWQQKVADRDRRLAELEQLCASQGITAGRGGSSASLGEDMRAALAERDSLIVTLQSQVQDLQGREGGETHVWTLERALEIRGRELDKLQGKLMTFAVQVEALDRQLADAMRGVVSESQAVMQQEEASPPPEGEGPAALRAYIADLEAQLAAGGGGGVPEDQQLLQTQVWTLEQALEIRQRENMRLNEMISDFIQQVSQMDAQLAAAMQQALKDSSTIRDQDEADAMGGATVEQALEEIKEEKKKKKATKKRAGSKKKDEEADGELGALAEKEIERLKQQLGRKEAQLQQYQTQARQRQLDWGAAAALGFGGHSMPSGTLGQTTSAVDGGAAGHTEYCDPSGRPLRTLQDYQAAVNRLTKQLEAAQRAIIAGTQYGWQRDLKLGEARRALTRMLEARGEWLCVGRSPSPSRGPQPHASQPGMLLSGGSSVSPPGEPPDSARGLPKAWMSWRDRAVAAAGSRPTAHVWQSPPRPPSLNQQQPASTGHAPAGYPAVPAQRSLRGGAG